jgi:peroxiredoxin
VQLQEQIAEIEKLNAQVIAIATAGNQQDAEKSIKNLEITYPLIPTPNKNIVDKYKLQYDSFMAAYATIIISKEGRIRFKNVEDRATRTSASTIIKELQSIQ